MQLTHQNKIFRCVQIAAVALFLGRAYQHLFRDAPLRTLLWDEGFMSGIVTRLSDLSWNEYITSPATDAGIQTAVIVMGCFYLLMVFVSAFIKKIPVVLQYLLPVASVLLVFLAFLYCKEKFYSVGQFLEYSLQFGTPLFLFFLWRKKEMTGRLAGWMRIAVALTFTCHGLYAVNYYPRPGLFVEMTVNGIGLSEGAAIQFLLFVGIMDFFISAVILFLTRPWINYALIYTVIWGFLTTMARIWAHLDMTYLSESLHDWGYETVYRFPHFLIPLALYFYFRSSKKINVVDENAPAHQSVVE